MTRRPAGSCPVVAVVGPTATGKSALAVALARRLGGEVVNADAMALYRGMDIGTAKVSESDRFGVAHHQLDVLDVWQQASVAAYQRAAREDIEAILRRGAVPILAGGSGLYVRAALDRLDIPPTDEQLRASLQRELDLLGVQALRQRLARLDPQAARSIAPGNGRRIVRALEVVTLTGRPFRATMPQREYLRPTVTVGLSLRRDVLDERIGARVAWMWRAGLVQEVRGLLARGLAAGGTARKALGYAQAMAQLAGDLTAEEAVAQTSAATRRFARRQQSWFGADPRVHWVPADAADLPERVLALVADNG
ncbi:MAG: tRNA (adenosine(37)-N6)-dimethylallyltransferase MiaA [Dermatophilaceae bacterium]